MGQECDRTEKRVVGFGAFFFFFFSLLSLGHMRMVFGRLGSQFRISRQGDSKSVNFVLLSGVGI